MVDKMTILPHGTTIEVFENRGHKKHLVCSNGGGMCRYAKTEDEATIFADTFEEFSKHVEVRVLSVI